MAKFLFLLLFYGNYLVVGLSVTALFSASAFTVGFARPNGLVLGSTSGADNVLRNSHSVLSLTLAFAVGAIMPSITNVFSLISFLSLIVFIFEVLLPVLNLLESQCIAHNAYDEGGSWPRHLSWGLVSVRRLKKNAASDTNCVVEECPEEVFLIFLITARLSLMAPVASTRLF